MKFLNFLGSSHLTTKHGFPQTLQRIYSESDAVFKSKYCIKSIKSRPGATYCHEEFLDSFLIDVKNQTSECDYSGQINILTMGSNDTQEISHLLRPHQNHALGQFKSNVNNFIDQLLSIKGSVVIVLSVLMPGSVYSVRTTDILEQVVR